MRVSQIFTAALSAVCAAAEVINLQQPLADNALGTPAEKALVEEDLKIPGHSPLFHCSGAKDDILQLDSVDLSPNPPEAGKTLTITAKGKFKEEIEEGAKVHLQVKYGVITIIRQTTDLCDLVGNVDLECPLSGQKSLTKDVDLPAQVPPGTYHVQADVYTKDERKITCLTATVTFARGGAASLKGFGGAGLSVSSHLKIDKKY